MALLAAGSMTINQELHGSKSSKARIVFDLDGTLIDSAPDIHGIANVLLTREKYEPITLEQTRNFIGNGAGVFVTKMCVARGIPDQEHGRLLADFISLYDNAVSHTLAYEGVEESLQALTGAGHSLGICTNKPIRPALSVLDHLDLAKYFNTVWGGDSMSVHKPNPAPLHAAFDALPHGVEIYVGDSEVDAETAARASVPFILFTEGYRKQAVEKMDHAAAFSHFRQLPELIAGLLQN